MYCWEKENQTLPGMRPFIGYPNTQKQQKQTGQNIYIYVCVSLLNTDTQSIYDCSKNNQRKEACNLREYGKWEVFKGGQVGKTEWRKVI